MIKVTIEEQNNMLNKLNNRLIYNYLCYHSVAITTQVVSSNPAHDEVFSGYSGFLHHYKLTETI